MKAAMVHFEPVFSRFDQSIFIKRTLKRVKGEMKTGDVFIPFYRLPVWEDKPSERALERFSSFLKEEKIEKVILSRQAEAFPAAIKTLQKSFQFFNGSAVINYKIYDILRKYASVKGLELADSTVVIETENPEKAKQFILKIYKHVKKIKINTKEKEKFAELSEFFLHEYGLFISFNEPAGDPEKELLIQLDSMLENKDALNLCCDPDRCDRIMFYCKQNFKNIFAFLSLDQMTLEFLIFQQFGHVNEDTMRRFFKEYYIRISKFKNND